MNFSRFAEGDRVEFTFEYCSIPKSATRSGEVSESLTVPGLGPVLFVAVELPTRPIEYELRESPDDEEEQVVKHLVKEESEAGTFGPLVTVHALD